MYAAQYSEEIVRKLAKLKKKDPAQYSIIRKKMDWVLANPEHHYKDLHHSMKGMQRIHLGHFVLIFIVDSVKKIVSFEDYDHHDRIYW